MLRYREVTDKDYRFLYELLKERDNKINISHVKLPSYEDHCDFCSRRGNGAYIEYNIIMNGQSKIGYYYVTDRKEVGIFIKKDFQGEGYGTQVIDSLKSRYDYLLANINPLNNVSQNLFKSRGFKLMQFTFVFDNKDDKNINKMFFDGPKSKNFRQLCTK